MAANTKRRNRPPRLRRSAPAGVAVSCSMVPLHTKMSNPASTTAHAMCTTASQNTMLPMSVRPAPKHLRTAISRVRPTMLPITMSR